MNVRLFRLLLISLLIVFSPLNAFCIGAASGLNDEEVLRLLKGEKVFGLVVSLDKKLSNNLFDKIADDIKQKFRLIGIEIPGDWILGAPYIYVNVDVLESGNDTYNGSIKLSFKDEIFFQKESIAGYAPLWEVSGVFASYSENDIKEKTDELFDLFFDVYARSKSKEIYRGVIPFLILQRYGVFYLEELSVEHDWGGLEIRITAVPISVNLVKKNMGRC